MGGVATKLIEKNTTIPASRSQTFSTAADNQSSVEIHVVQGERPMASDNKSLGRFILDGIPPAPRGMPQIDVSFDIDANGILNVKAKDKATSKEQSIRIEAKSGLTPEDIDRMQKEADLHKDEDAKKKESVESRNMAEQLVYSAEKSLKDAEGKISDEIKISVQEKIDALKKEKDGIDSEAIKKASDELSTEMQKIGEYMSKNAAQATPDVTQASEQATATDAEFQEKPKDDTGTNAS